MPELKLLRPEWQGLDDATDRARALDFFAVFARFEYALKMAGFAKGAEGRPAAPNWDAFILKVETYTPPSALALDAAVDALVDTPPKTQIMKNGEVIFPPVARPPKGNTRFAQAVSAAKQVRNNLFHGGKYMRNEEPSNRNRLLIQCSLTVLSAAINADERLTYIYYNG